MDSKIKEQILAIIALREGYYELVIFLADDKADYARYILTGDD